MGRTPLAELRALQAEYQAWRDHLPESLAEGVEVDVADLLEQLGGAGVAAAAATPGSDNGASVNFGLACVPEPRPRAARDGSGGRTASTSSLRPSTARAAPPAS